MKGVIRIRSEKFKGWQARRYAKPRETRAFADSAHGGSRGAHRAAAQWLARRHSAAGEHPTDRRILRAPRPNGEPPGVYRARCFGRDGWMAAWTDADGVLHRRWFATDKHGPETLNEAVKWRREAERQVHGVLMPATRYAIDRKRLIRERA